jgi:putative hydrolase of the HAD superfamily
MPWNEIDTVLLDMDGTLLDLHFDYHFWMSYLPKIYAEKNNLSISEANDFIHQKIHSQTGTLNWYCLDYWTEQLNLPIAELKHDLKHLIKPHPKVMDFLHTLKQQNKQIIMVTNAHRDSLAIKMQETEIEHYFNHLISSHDYGKPKEDIQIWQDIQQDIPYNPEKTLLIDDNITALTTAKEFGIKYCLAATFVSNKMPKIDPKDFLHFERFEQIMPT